MFISARVLRGVGVCVQGPAAARILSSAIQAAPFDAHLYAIGRIIVNFGLAMVMFWEPVYLYQIGYSLQKIVSFYLVTYVAYMIFMPLGAKFAKRYGYEASLAIGTSLYALFYISLYFVQFYPPFFYVAALILTLQKLFYWPAYHANFAKYIGKDEEGREISLMTVATS